jgi:2-polyprenyl-6-hydroxyphenyl methylase/3-demethylubiquinone-9 3-methyltransferase
VPPDNDVYQRLGDSWWDEASPLNLLHGSVTPGRLGYFRGVLTRRFGPGLAGLRVLDIGCGGGFLSEEFAALGCRVAGVDPATASAGTARAHAAARGLRVGYLAGTGEELPFKDAAFDVACCCDVLEHVADPDRVIGETARVLKPGGLYLFDTVNRTRTSRLMAIKVMQQWPLTRLTDVAIHDWDQFITPAELAVLLARHGFAVGEMTGLGARARPGTVLRALAAVRLGRISLGEFSRRLDVGPVRSKAVSYLGYAVKRLRQVRGQFLGTGLPAQYPEQLVLRPGEPVGGIGQRAGRPPRQRPGDRLANPPGRVHAEPVPPGGIVVPRRAGEAGVAGLHQVRERHAASGVPPGGRHHQVKAGLRQPLACLDTVRPPGLRPRRERGLLVGGEPRRPGRPAQVVPQQAGAVGVRGEPQHEPGPPGRGVVPALVLPGEIGSEPRVELGDEQARVVVGCHDAAPSPDG